MTAEPGDYGRRTMQAYDNLSGELGEGYDAHFRSMAQLEADRFMAGLRPGSAVLDLGCGAGVASSYFGRHGFRAVATDLSAAVLSECVRRGLRNIRLRMYALDTLGHLACHVRMSDKVGATHPRPEAIPRLEIELAVEPAALDRFLPQLRRLIADRSGQAVLDIVRTWR